MTAHRCPAKRESTAQTLALSMLWGGLAPAMATIVPSTNSCFVSLAASRARYSFSVNAVGAAELLLEAYSIVSTRRDIIGPSVGVVRAFLTDRADLSESHPSDLWAPTDAAFSRLLGPEWLLSSLVQRRALTSSGACGMR